MISQDKYFYLKNGESLRSIDELLLELDKNTNNVNLDNFYFHVNNEKNDYANWIKNVFFDDELYSALKDKKDPVKFLSALKETLNKRKDEDFTVGGIQSEANSEVNIAKEKNVNIENHTGENLSSNKSSKKLKDYLKTLKTKVKVDRFKKILSKKQINKGENTNNKSEEVKTPEEQKELINKETKKEEELQKSSETKDANQNKITIKAESEVSKDIIQEENKLNEEVVTSNREKFIFDEKRAEELSEHSDKLLEQTKTLKKNSYMNLEKQKETVSQLTESYEELYEKIAEYRKKGEDMFMPEMHLRLIKPKLHFLEVSNSFEDRMKIKLLLSEVEEEINEALGIKKPDLKTEILKKAGLFKVKKED